MAPLSVFFDLALRFLLFLLEDELFLFLFISILDLVFLTWYDSNAWTTVVVSDSLLEGEDECSVEVLDLLGNEDDEEEYNT
jgi:hypothetical protein